MQTFKKNSTFVKTMDLTVKQRYRNKALIGLCDSLLGDKRYDDLVLLGEIIFGDSHPSVLKTYELMTNMVDYDGVVNIREKVLLKLKEHLDNDKKNNTYS